MYVPGIYGGDAGRCKSKDPDIRRLYYKKPRGQPYNQIHLLVHGQVSDIYVDYTWDIPGIFLV